MGGRIIAVADTVDSMLSNRVYRRALTLEALKEELKRFSGIQFDPAVVNAFEALITRMGMENFLKALNIDAGVTASN